AGGLALPPAAGDGQSGQDRLDRPPGRRRRTDTLTTAGVAGVRSPSMSTLLLIDGLSLAYRAFYALPADLATPEATITNAVYGFTSMLVKVLGDEQPDGIAVVFDAPGPTFRHALDSDYKATARRRPTSSCRRSR